jgi:hypothetical protein
MKPLLNLVRAHSVVFLSVLIAIQALSLSYNKKASDARSCFYIPITDTAAQIQFYYQVFFQPVHGNLFVQVVNKANENAKGNVNVVVEGPQGQELQKFTAQSQAEFGISAVSVGDHAICFTHMGAPTDKTIDLDISLTNRDGTPFVAPKSAAEMAAQVLNPDASTVELENAVNRVTKDLTEISHTLKSLKSREKRNLLTVESNARIISRFSLFETALIVGMAVCQVALLRHSFGRSGRPRV